MNNPVIAVILVYLVIATLLAFFTVVVFRKRVFGHMWGAFLVALIGTVLGGVVADVFRSAIKSLSNLFGVINIFPPLIVAIVCLVLYTMTTVRK